MSTNTLDTDDLGRIPRTTCCPESLKELSLDAESELGPEHRQMSLSYNSKWVSRFYLSKMVFKIVIEHRLFPSEYGFIYPTKWCVSEEILGSEWKRSTKSSPFPLQLSETNFLCTEVGSQIYNGISEKVQPRLQTHCLPGWKWSQVPALSKPQKSHARPTAAAMLVA